MLAVVQLTWDWASFTSAIVGAIAALGGVWVTQRSERRRAHDDRIWSQRLDVYVTLMSWAENWRRFGSYHSRSGRGWASSVPRQPDPLLPGDEYAKLQAFASGAVLERTKELSRTAFGVWREPEPASEAPLPNEEDYGDVWQKALDLREGIRAEMGATDIEAGPVV